MIGIAGIYRYITYVIITVPTMYRYTKYLLLRNFLPLFAFTILYISIPYNFSNICLFIVLYFGFRHCQRLHCVYTLRPCSGTVRGTGMLLMVFHVYSEHYTRLLVTKACSDTTSDCGKSVSITRL